MSRFARVVHRVFAVAVFAAALGASGRLLAFTPDATLYLKDGSRLVGRLVAQDSDKVVFETEGGKVTYPQSRVSKVEFDAAPEATPPASPETEPAAPPARLLKRSLPAPVPSGPLPDDLLHHEPHFLEPVGVHHRHQIDFGGGMALDSYHAQGVSTSVFDVLYLRLMGSLGYRFAPGPRAQFGVSAPFLYQLLTFSGTSGVTVEDVSSTGLGQMTLGGRVSLTDNFAAQGFLELPTGDVDADIPTGEGMNLGGMLLARAGRGPVAIHAGAGVIVKSEYDKTAAGTTFTVDPGDLAVLSLALTTQGRPHARRFGGGAVQVGGVLELNSYTIGDMEAGGATVADSGGTASNLAVGLTVGTRSGSVDNLFKIGFAFGIGEESHTSFDTVRGAGDLLYYFTMSGRWGRIER